MSAVAAPLPSGAELGRTPARKHVVRVVLGSVAFGALAGAAATGGSATTVFALIAIFMPIAVWRRPQLGPVLLLLTGLLIEQFNVGLSNDGVTVGVPITQSIPMFRGLGSLHLEPADLLPVIIFAIYWLRTKGTGARWVPRTQLSLAVVAVIGFVLFAEINGLAHHGDMRESMFECRPFIYFGCAYLLTAVMIRTRTAVLAVLWAIVVAEIIKSIQAIDVYITTRNWAPRPQSVVGHEEAMFFSLFFILVAVLWMFNVRGRLRTVATRAMPLVVMADLANDRRAAWLVLGAGLVVLLATGFRILPHRRRKLRRVLLVTLALFSVYLPAYWNHTDGTLGKPADAVRSAFSPSPRDALSNEYRVDEDANLKFNIKQNGVLGAGFGQLIDYALPMPGLVTASDAGITYVPHNSVLYIPMRMGLLGSTAFWAMLGAAIIAGLRLARCPDRLFAAIGTLVAAITVGWALEGGTDMGFTFPRIAIVMGCLLGLLEASRHIHVMSRRARARRRAGAYPTGALGASGRKTPSLQVVG